MAWITLRDRHHPDVPCPECKTALLLPPAYEVDEAKYRALLVCNVCMFEGPAADYDQKRKPKAE